MNKKSLFIIFVLIIIISGCVSQDSSSTEEGINQKIVIAKTTKKSLSEMALQIKDLPEGKNWTLVERTERVKSEVSEEAIQKGWKEGYYVQYSWIDLYNLQAIHVYQKISKYPIINNKLNITPDFKLIKEAYKIGLILGDYNITSVDELSSPNIGDLSIAYRITFMDTFTNDVSRYYGIQFIKMDIFETIEMEGTILDYELLKEVAKKAEKKIN